MNTMIRPTIHINGRPTIRINGSKLVRSIRKHARNNPHHQAMCAYQINGKPECIIGRALADQHVDLVPLRGTTFEGLCSPNSHVARVHIKVSPRYAAWASLVQRAQDDTMPWADAVAHADSKLGKVW